MRRRAPALALLAPLILAACAPTAAEQHPAFMETPRMERTLAAAGAAGGGLETNWPKDKWWRVFRSAELDALIEKAQLDNQNLRRAADKLAQAEAISKIEGARLMPMIDADLGMRQSRIPNHGVVASYNPRLAGLEKTMAFINPLSLRYEFDFWGKNRAALDAALGEAAAKEAEFADAQLLLTTALVRAYARGAAAARQLELAREMTKLRRELLHLARERWRSGLDTQDAIALAEADVETAMKRETVPAAVLGLQQDLIARLSGEGPDAGRDLFSHARARLAQPPAPKKLPVELLANRPDLSAAMRRAEAAAERIHVAKAEFLPSFDLSLTAGLEASVTTSSIGRLGSFLFRPSAFNYAVMPGVHLPIFQGGRLQGRLAGRNAEYDEAVDAYNDTLLAAAQQTADSLVALKQTRAALDAQTRLVAAMRRKLELSRQRWRQGIKDRREIVANALDVLEQTYAQRWLEADLAAAHVDLAQALGGGYGGNADPSRLPPAPEQDELTPVVDIVRQLGGG